MMERKRVQQGTRERVGSTVRSRSGGFAFSSSRPYSGNSDFDIIYSALQGTSGCFNDNLGVLSGEIESRVTTRTCSFGVNDETLLRSDMSCEGRAVADHSAGRVLCTHVFFRGFRQPTPRTRVRGTRPLIVVSENGESRTTVTKRI